MRIGLVSVFGLFLMALISLREGNAQSAGGFTMRVDVEMVTVEATALDKNGKAIRNLKKEDFELYEDGKRQEILTLDEVAPESAFSALGASPLDRDEAHRGKTVLILFNYAGIHPMNHTLARESAEHFVSTHMGPHDLFAVGFFGAETRILQNFTRERQEVLAAIRQPIGAEAVASASSDSMLRSLESISRSIAPIKGAKSIVVFSQYEPSSESVSYKDTYYRTIRWLQKANAAVYSVIPSRLPGGSMNSTPAVMQVSTLGSLPRISTVAPPIVGLPSTSTGAPSVVALPQELFRVVAKDTGGYTIYNTNNFNAALDDFAERIGNYYILGFESANPRHDGGFRKIEIKTKRKGVVLKHRPGYQDRRPIDVLASAKQEQMLLTALADPRSATQLQVAMIPAYFYEAAGSAKALTMMSLPLAGVSFTKKGNQIGADMSIMGAAYAEDGRLAARFSETIPLRFEKEQEAEARNGILPYRNQFRLRPGKYRIKVAVSDESNSLGAAERTLEIPALVEGRIAGSSVIVARELSPLPELIRALETQLFDESDPLFYSKVQVQPSADNVLSVTAPLDVLFRLYHLDSLSDRSSLSAKVKLTDEKGSVRALPPIALNELLLPAGPGEAVVGMRLPFRDHVQGKCRLAIEVTGSKAGESAELQTEIVFR